MDWIIIGGLLIIIVTQILLRPKQLNNNKEDLEKLLNEIQRSFDRIEKNFREDFRLNREESRLVAKDNREELARSMNEFKEAFERGIDSFNRLQKEKFAALDERQQRLVDNTEKRLEEIRVTVDEKLQKTLNDRIGQSFRLVTEQLESVQKGLGEMQTLAQDVGGLKRVLSNVKTRGNIGEIQLSMLLEQLLAPEQYEANVHTRKGSDAVVEFAVKLPGRDDAREFVYLPIDAKFPKDVYEQLLDAYDAADSQAIETAGKLLETTIKKMAKDISDKYLASRHDRFRHYVPAVRGHLRRGRTPFRFIGGLATKLQGSRNRSHYPSGHTKQFTNGLPYIGDPKALRGGMDDLRGREKRIRESRRYARESPKELANRQRANRRGFRYPYPCHPT